jgi:hypothetical protein
MNLGTLVSKAIPRKSDRELLFQLDAVSIGVLHGLVHGRLDEELEHLVPTHLSQKF